MLARLGALGLVLGSLAGLAGACASSESSDGTGGSATGTGGQGAQGGTPTGGQGGSPSGGAGGTGGQGAVATGGQGGQGGAPCPEGTLVCEGTLARTCDGNGGFTTTVDCAPDICVPGLGCAVCVPGSAACNGSSSEVCAPDGSGYLTTFCDPDQGVTCNPNTGKCVGACAPEALSRSYIGCDYYPTVTSNVVSSTPFYFAVIVSNTTSNPANVLVTRGAATVATTTVAASSVAVVQLPWVDTLKNNTTTVLVPSGAYRLRTDQPVTVYQYNPLQYTLQSQYSYTNDASLLLPVNAWTGEYRTAARQTLSTGLPGFIAITASEDGTTVSLSPGPMGGGVSAGAGISATGDGTATLNRGDVLEVFSGGSADPGDMSGSLVSADKPVQVIGGHTCTYLPDPVCCCDHIEETVPPVAALGTRYLVTPPIVAAGGNPVQQVVRFIATADNTTLTYDPPQPGAPTDIAQAGGFVELVNSTADFEVEASSRIIAVQYMEGQQSVGMGDPAMTLAVPVQQYRTSYLFHAPTNYEASFVNVTAPTGTAVTLDGAPVVGFVPIGGSGYSVARVALSNAGSGDHTVDAPEAVGVSVYGYGQYTSYWYPGGQNVQLIGN
ncbi:MAG: IgGFc-binding protein [Polyangiaceae bacterium]|nr:IgGFc-binding protein [Polyangiaceae bacterium]